MSNFYDWDLKEKYYQMASETNKKFIETWQYKKIYSFIKEIFSDKDKVRIAEFWCGEWWKLLPFVNNKYDISWYDISKYALEIAKKQIPQWDFYYSDITKPIEISKKHDVCMSFFALEHIPNLLPAMDNIISATNNWWYIILRYPNYGSYLFPSPPVLYKYKFNKVFLILKRLRKSILNRQIYDTVVPIENNYDQPDYDVTTEIHMKKLENYVIKKLCKVVYSSSCREEMKWISHYCKFLPNGKYLWPQSFFIFQKK